MRNYFTRENNKLDVSKLCPVMQNIVFRYNLNVRFTASLLQ